MKVGFIQQFGIGENGGGPKILRSLIANQPFEWRSICTQVRAPQTVLIARGSQTWLPARPATRLDRTRFKWLADRLDPLFARRLRTRILAACDGEQFDAVHIVPHGVYDWQFAAEYGLHTGTPLIMSIHDDIRYTFPESMYRANIARFADVWRQAQHVFCISEDLGQEYCDRYGNRSYELLTDGAEEIAAAPRARRKNRLRVYFCGLMHYSYLSNFAILLSALERLSKKNDTRLTLRGAVPFADMQRFQSRIDVLPFAYDISHDFDDVDVLYLPLQFGEEQRDFVRYSMSTKLVSYLSTGVPILYHGPAESALHRLLSLHHAAISVLTERSEDVSAALEEAASSRGTEVAQAALALARSRFSLSQQRMAFRSALERCCGRT